VAKVAASAEKQVLAVDKATSDPYKVVVGVPYVPVVVALFVPTVAAFEVEARVSLPDGARLERATFGIGASPSMQTVVSSVASVRAGDGSTCVIDFGRMVTVNGFAFHPTDSTHGVSGISRWTGSSWTFISNDGGFDEVSTERLLVAVTGGGDIEAAVGKAGVWLQKQPTSLELVVDGATVWFERQGSASDLITKVAGKDLVTGTSGVVPKTDVQKTGVQKAAVQYGVDRTDALREAFAKAVVVERDKVLQREVTVKLRAATPGDLSLDADLSMLHEHAVTFGSSSHSSTIDAAEEGSRPLVLNGPFAEGDLVREIAMTLTGAFGPERIEPVDGPPVDGDAELVLGAGRTLLFGIPTSLASLFGELQGIRLLLRSDRGGEIAGRLLAAVGADGQPGEPVKGAELSPMQVPARPPGWFTIALPKAVPLEIPAGSPVGAWLELVPSYGEVSCALTTSTAAGAPGAPVLRRLPGGGTKRMSSLQSATDPSQTTMLYACLRVVGLPGQRDSRPAVEVPVPGGSGVALADPTGDKLRVVLGLGSGISAQDGSVPLTLRIAGWGSVTADDVVVAYQKGGPS
jgi:hypothetical protein